MTQAVENANFQGKKLFHFSPDIKGEPVLVGDRIIEFRPSAPLQSNTTYTAEFYLNELVKTEEKFNIMPFQFSTIQQSFSVTLESLKNYEGGHLIKCSFRGIC